MSTSQNAAVDAALRQLRAEDDDDYDDEKNLDEPAFRLRDLGLTEDDDSRSVAGTEYDGKSTFGDDDQDLEFLDGSKVTEADELVLGLFNSLVNEPNTTDNAGHRNAVCILA